MLLRSTCEPRDLRLVQAWIAVLLAVWWVIPRRMPQDGEEQVGLALQLWMLSLTVGPYLLVTSLAYARAIGETASPIEHRNVRRVLVALPLFVGCLATLAGLGSIMLGVASLIDS